MIEFVDAGHLLLQAPNVGVISSGPDDKLTVAGAVARRFVDLVRDGSPLQHVARGRSNAQGGYAFAGLPTSQEYIVIGRENRHARVWNDVIRAGIYPVADE